MDIQQLDVVVRVSCVAMLLLLAAMLIRESRDRHAVIFLPLAICLSGFLMGNSPDAATRLTGIAGDVAHLLSGYAAVFLWWFCLSVFDRHFKPEGLVLGTGIAWLIVASADRGLFGQALADKDLSRLLVVIGFTMIVHLAWRLVRDREGDLLEMRREARMLVVLLLGGQLLLDLSVDVVLGFQWRPRIFTMVQNAAILVFTLWLLGVLLRVSSDTLTRSRVTHREPPLAPARSGGAAEAKRIQRLQTLMEVERVYLDPHLSFRAFARKMGASERTVRHLINHQLGHDHFRSFLNMHRIDEARRLLAAPGRAGDKLISIALDSGFASLASFNRVFRASAGCTPSEFRDALHAMGDAETAQAHETTDQSSPGWLKPAFGERSAAF